jgi:hypothetical protein
MVRKRILVLIGLLIFLVSLIPAPAQTQPIGQAKVAIISARFFLPSSAPVPAPAGLS